MKKQRDAYISLKEAAKVSGYAPDYIGQLIREGKLKGKQVYTGVSWLTTEASLREYIAKKRESIQENNNKTRSTSFIKKASPVGAFLFMKHSQPGIYLFIIFFLGVLTSFFILSFTF